MTNTGNQTLSNVTTGGHGRRRDDQRRSDRDAGGGRGGQHDVHRQLHDPQADIDAETFHNEALVTGTSPGGPDVTDSATADTPLAAGPVDRVDQDGDVPGRERGRQCGRGRDDPLRIHGDQHGQRDAEQRDVGGHGRRRDGQRRSDRDAGGGGRGQHDVHGQLHDHARRTSTRDRSSTTAWSRGRSPSGQPVTDAATADTPLPQPRRSSWSRWASSRTRTRTATRTWARRSATLHGDQHGQRDADERDAGGHGGRRDDQRRSDRDAGGGGRGQHDVHGQLHDHPGGHRRGLVLQYGDGHGDGPHGRSGHGRRRPQRRCRRAPSIVLVKTGEFQDENGDGNADVGETIRYASR